MSASPSRLKFIPLPLAAGRQERLFQIVQPYLLPRCPVPGTCQQPATIEGCGIVPHRFPLARSLGEAPVELQVVPVAVAHGPFLPEGSPAPADRRAATIAGCESSCTPARGATCAIRPAR